jgi:hypothetical protein
MTTSAETAKSSPNPDAALMIGGPAGDHGKEMPKDGEVHPDLKKSEEKVKYELNGKSFSSPEEMSKYVADLEQKVINQPIQTQAPIQTQLTKQQILVDGMTLDQLMFANPERYYQYTMDQAGKLADARIQAVENKRNFWSEFYTNNPDLRGKEELVDAVVSRNWNGNWEKMQVKDFAKAAADSSRSLIKRIGPANAQEVRGGDSAALSPSGQNAPVVEIPRQSTNFVEEMKIRNAKRIKAKVR